MPYRLVNLQTVLQDTQESARKIEIGLDERIEADETTLLVSRFSHSTAEPMDADTNLTLSYYSFA